MTTELNPIVSVVVATRNRAALLQENIASLLQQDYPSLELVYVNDGSKDETADVLNKLRDAHPDRVVVLHFDGIGPGPARNAGVRASEGSIILFIDDDATAGPTWVSDMLACRLRHNCEVMGGGVHAKSMDTPIEAYLHYRQQIPLGNTAGTVRAVPSVNMLITRTAFDAVNGFREDYLPLGEDWELCYRLRAKGYAIHYDPSPFVVHRYRNESDRARRLMRIHGATGIYISTHYRSMLAYVVYSVVRSLLSPIWVLRHYPKGLRLLAIRMEWEFLRGRLFGYRAYLRGRKDFPQ